MPCRHLLTEMAQLSETHRIMILSTVGCALVVSLSSRPILLRTIQSAIPACRGGRPLLSYSHCMLIKLGLIDLIRLVLVALSASAITVLVWHVCWGAHASERATSDGCQGRACDQSRRQRRLHHSSCSLQSVILQAPISEGRVCRVETLQLVHARHRCLRHLSASPCRPLRRHSLLLLLVLLRFHLSDFIFNLDTES